MMFAGEQKSFIQIITNPEYQDKSILLSIHGFTLQCLLRQIYEDKSDFWHGKIPDNCVVNIVEVIDGKGILVGDDLIFYNQSLAVNPYKPI